MGLTKKTQQDWNLFGSRKKKREAKALAEAERSKEFWSGFEESKPETHLTKPMTPQDYGEYIKSTSDRYVDKDETVDAIVEYPKEKETVEAKVTYD